MSNENRIVQNTSTIDVLSNCLYGSTYLEEQFDKMKAASFAVGSEMLLGEINDDLSDLSLLPKGAHVGQLDKSNLVEILPQQFITEYNYEFLYALKCAVLRLQKYAKAGAEIHPRNVLEEIAIYLMMQEAQCIQDGYPGLGDDSWLDLLFDDDGDMSMALYDDVYIKKDSTYHFKHWLENFEDQ